LDFCGKVLGEEGSPFFSSFLFKEIGWMIGTFPFFIFACLPFSEKWLMGHPSTAASGFYPLFNRPTLSKSRFGSPFDKRPTQNFLVCQIFENPIPVIVLSPIFFLSVPFPLFPIGRHLLKCATTVGQPPNPVK